VLNPDHDGQLFTLWFVIEKNVSLTSVDFFLEIVPRLSTSTSFALWHHFPIISLAKTLFLRHYFKLTAR
jgi:hypothetical protein